MLPSYRSFLAPSLARDQVGTPLVFLLRAEVGINGEGKTTTSLLSPSLRPVLPSHLTPYHDALHSTSPPTFLSSASLTSSTPRSVLRKSISPRFRPLIWRTGKPRATRESSFTLAVTRRDGFEMGSTSRSTGSLFQYLSPTHSRRVATLAVVTGSVSAADSASGGGGLGPPRVTLAISPARCIASSSRRLYLVLGTDVSPSRARDAFWRWMHAFTTEWTPIFFFLGVSEGRRLGCGCLPSARAGVRDSGAVSSLWVPVYFFESAGERVVGGSKTSRG